MLLHKLFKIPIACLRFVPVKICKNSPIIWLYQLIDLRKKMLFLFRLRYFIPLFTLLEIRFTLDAVNDDLLKKIIREYVETQH